MQFLHLPSFHNCNFFHYCRNAIKYKHPKRNPEILIASECFDTHTNLVVKDNGIGIPNSMLPNFLISSHKDQAKNPKGILGIGLGLEEVQSYVDAHEGIIWVESEENKGTTFFIELQLGN